MQNPEQAMAQHHAEADHGHPAPRTYILIATVLTVITIIEVGVYYIEAVRSFFVPIFLALSAVKFALVAMFYMHLKFDARLFSVFFFGGLALAASITVALMGIIGVF